VQLLSKKANITGSPARFEAQQAADAPREVLTHARKARRKNARADQRIFLPQFLKAMSLASI
jgi:hypothetical protein